MKIRADLVEPWRSDSQPTMKLRYLPEAQLYIFCPCLGKDFVV